VSDLSSLWIFRKNAKKKKKKPLNNDFFEKELKNGAVTGNRE